MNLLYALAAFLVAIVCVLVGVTRVNSWLIERRYPPVGSFAEVNGARIHYVHIPAGPNADLPPVVFIHGASANLNDQLLALRPPLEGRAEMLFFDRPGHGWSGRGPGNNETQFGQAETISALMGQLGMSRAILVGHSFGGSVETAFALSHPEKTAGLAFLSAATHPWPGGKTSWYYDVATIPILGRLFTETLVNPVGSIGIDKAADCVFSPNPVAENYVARTSIPLVLRPSAFRSNAIDVAGMYDFAVATQPRYREIKAPTVVISGDADAIVYEEIHSVGLARDIPGAEAVWVRNMGHKSDWVAPDLVVAAIEKLAGQPRDLQAMAARVSARVANDAQGKDKCVDEKAPAGELAPL